MAEGGEEFQSQQKETVFGKGEKIPRVVEGSVVRPAGQVGNWFDQEMPYEELVDNIRGVVERARARHRPTAPEPFNSAEWLGEELIETVNKHQDNAEERQRYSDLLTAWDALAYTRYTDGSDGSFKWSETVRRRLENQVQDTKQTSLTLPPQGVKALDAIAEVAGIPREKGEATIDLTPFTQRYSWRQESTWFDQERPYEEVVGDMRQLVARTQAKYPQSATEPFNSAAAFGVYLEKLAVQEFPDQQRYIDLYVAWGALAHTRYPVNSRHQIDQEYARSQVESHVRHSGRISLTMPPEIARVLDAMAEVAGIPRKRGETTIDLTPFVRPNNKS